MKLFPDPASRPRQREMLIELLRKGEVDEAFRTFKKIYLEVAHRMIDHLETGHLLTPLNNVYLLLVHIWLIGFVCSPVQSAVLRTFASNARRDLHPGCTVE
jgi:hypothetical protein